MLNHFDLPNEPLIRVALTTYLPTSMEDFSILPTTKVEEFFSRLTIACRPTMPRPVSVIRWLDNFFNFWPFTPKKAGPIATFCKRRFKVLSNPK